MFAPPSNPSATTAASAVLAGLVEQVADHLAQGRQADVDALLAGNPDHAERLRQLLPAMGLLANVGQGEPNQAVDLAAIDGGASSALAVSGVLGDFHIQREVGRGGMGVVYEAEQISLSRRVALKVLPFAGMLDTRQLQRFTNEAKAAAGLHHQNIVPVYAVGSDRGVHFYAMQLIAGRTLAQMISELRSQHLPRSETGTAQAAIATRPIGCLSTADGHKSLEWCRCVARWGAQIADALEYAHSVGIVHRDIKPANLMLDDEGKVWVTDFGLAQMEADAGLTMTGGVVGTLRYMSPEQAAGEKGLVDQRTDVYSLGVTLYELLTLEPAFRANDHKALLRQVIDDDPRRPRLVNAALPRDLETIILKAMRKDSPQRYPTAAALAADLRRYLADRPIAARRPGLVERTARWCRRRGRWLAAATAAFVLALVGLSAGIVLIMNERNQTAYERKLREQQEPVARAGAASMRLNRYVLDIALAAQEFDEVRFVSAKEHLEHCIPAEGEEDLRGFEWHYLWRLVHTFPAPFGRHDARVFHIHFSPDGRLLATGGADGVRIWNYESGEQVAWLKEHAPAVSRARFSPDGTMLATTGEDQRVLIWDTMTWAIVRTIPMPWTTIGAEFNPDGTRLFVIEASPIRPNGQLDSASCHITVFDTSTWESLWALDELPFVRGGTFAPDGATFVLACGDRLRFFDVATKLEINNEYLIKADHDVAYSPTEPLLVAAAWDSAKIVHLPLAGGRSIEVLPIDCKWVSSVSFATDGRLILAANRHAQIWAFPSGQSDVSFLTATLRHPSSVLTARFAPNGRSVATSDDQRTVRRWDLGSPIEGRRLLDFSRIPTRVSFTSAGDRLNVLERLREGRVGRDEGSVRDPRSGDRLLSHIDPAAVDWTAANSCRKFIVQSDRGHHHIRDAVTGELELDIPREYNYGGPAFSRDCRFAAFGVTERSVHILNCRDWSETVAFAWDAGTINALAWSPDGRTLAIGSVRGIVELWNAAIGRKMLTLVKDMEYVHSIAFSANGQFLAAAGFASQGTGDLRIWQIDPDASPGVPAAAPLDHASPAAP